MNLQKSVFFIIFHQFDSKHDISYLQYVFYLSVDGYLSEAGSPWNKTPQWMAVVKLIFIQNIDILNEYKMDTKYNNYIICQIEMIDTRSNIFEILWNSMNIQKSAIFLKHFLNSNQNTVHTSNMSSILVWNYDNTIVYTFGRYSLHMRSNI